CPAAERARDEPHLNLGARGTSQFRWFVVALSFLQTSRFSLPGRDPNGPLLQCRRLLSSRRTARRHLTLRWRSNLPETNFKAYLQASPRKRSFLFHGLRGATGNSHASFGRTKRRASRPRTPDPLGIAGSERHLRRSVDFGGSVARDAEEAGNRSRRLFCLPGPLAPSSQRTGRSRPRRNRFHARCWRRREPSWFCKVR